MATKTDTIAIKVTPEEKELIKKLADRSGITVSKFLHEIIFKEVIAPMTRDKAYNELIHYVAGDSLDKMSDEQLIALYNNFFKQ